MSYGSWTHVALGFAIGTGILTGLPGHPRPFGSVLCTFWTAVWLQRRANEDRGDDRASD